MDGGLQWSGGNSAAIPATVAAGKMSGSRESRAAERDRGNRDDDQSEMAFSFSCLGFLDGMHSIANLRRSGCCVSRLPMSLGRAR
jgi:hypothetical protein